MHFLFNLLLLYLAYKFFTILFSSRTNDYGPQSFGSDTTSPFDDALLTILAAAMKADGRVTRPELDVVKRVLISQYGEADAQRKLLSLRDILKTNINIKSAAMKVGTAFSYADRLTIANILCEIAEADGIITASEAQTVTNIAFYMGLSRQDITNISMRLHVNGSERGKDYGSYGSGATNSSEPSLAQAYATLGVKQDATNAELKDAYRSLVKKYHPDRFASQGAEAQAQAETKFKEIQAAYDKIKTARGL